MEWYSIIIDSGSTNILHYTSVHWHTHTYARTHILTGTAVIETLSTADVNSARQMQGFNSGTTAWFAWAAACLSLIRTCSNTQRTGSWRKSPSKGAQTCWCIRERAACVSWLDLHTGLYCATISLGHLCHGAIQEKARKQGHKTRSSGHFNFHLFTTNTQCASLFTPRLRG